MKLLKWERMACRLLWGQVTCSMGCPPEGMAPPRADRRAALLPYQTLQKLITGVCACQGACHSTCPIVDCSLHPLWTVQSTLHRTTAYSSRQPQACCANLAEVINASRGRAKCKTFYNNVESLRRELAWLSLSNGRVTVAKGTRIFKTS